MGAAARDVGRELDHLVEEVSGYCGSELLQVAAYFHCRFENIHPSPRVMAPPAVCL